MASLPEWKSVPSPMFWNMCGVSVKGAMPTHCAPSPPMWVTPMMPRSMPMAMPWQPMPAAATAPVRHHGGAVVRAARAEEGGARERERARPALELVQVLDARLHRLDARLPGQPPGDARARWCRSPARRSTGMSARSSSSCLPTTRGRSGAAVEHVLGEHLEEGPLLLDDEDLLEAAGELADDARLHREHEPHLEDADAVAAERGLVQAQLVEAPGARRSTSCRW